MNLHVRSTVSAGLLAFMGVAMGMAAVLAVGGGSPARALINCTGGNPGMDSEETAFLGMINQYRSDNGLGTLSVAPSLDRAAAWMVNDLGTNAYFGHTDSLGRNPSQRAQDCDYPGGAGENIAAGTVWDTAQKAFDAWKNSPGHNANMLNSSYIAIGIARENVPGSPYGWYWGTSFGLVVEGGGGGSTPPPAATNTQAPATNTPTATNTPQATSTPTATSTPPPGSTSTPTAPATPAPNTPTATSTAAASASPTPTFAPTATSTPTATATPTPADDSVDLFKGANLVTWGGADAHPKQVVTDSDGAITAIYGYDPVLERWYRYSPQLPGYSNTLTSLIQGYAYWFLANSSVALPMEQ